MIEFYEGETTVYGATGERLAQGRVFLKRTIDAKAAEIREEILVEDAIADSIDLDRLRAGVRTLVLDGLDSSSFTVVDAADQVQGFGEITAGRLSTTTRTQGGATLEQLREQTSRGFFTQTHTFDARGVTVSRSEGILHKISSERYARETERLESPEG